MPHHLHALIFWLLSLATYSEAVLGMTSETGMFHKTRPFSPVSQLVQFDIIYYYLLLEFLSGMSLRQTDPLYGILIPNMACKVCCFKIIGKLG